jgi:hypothetical protein
MNKQDIFIVSLDMITVSKLSMVNGRWKSTPESSYSRYLHELYTFNKNKGCWIYKSFRSQQILKLEDIVFDESFAYRIREEVMIKQISKRKNLIG